MLGSRSSAYVVRAAHGASVLTFYIDQVVKTQYVIGRELQRAS